MQILVAEDDPGTRLLLATHLARWGYRVREAERGNEAWRVLQEPDGPSIAVLDWGLPDTDGVELCRRLADRSAGHRPVYTLIVTARDRKEDVVAALEAGADDYLTKPFHDGELRARVEAGRRIVTLQSELRARVEELEAALTRVKELEGLVPICAYCKQIRDDREFWHGIEKYLAERLHVQFTHGICPDCLAPRLDELDPSS